MALFPDMWKEPDKAIRKMSIVLTVESLFFYHTLLCCNLSHRETNTFIFQKRPILGQTFGRFATTEETEDNL